MENRFLKSALNYTGGKYRLLPQLFPLFPTKFERFIDLFAGGGVVSVNVAKEFSLKSYGLDKNIVVNDIEPHVISLLSYLARENMDTILEKIYFYIDKYGLSNTEKYGYEPYLLTDKRDVSAFNKEKYKILRDEYNTSNSKDNNILFYLLIVFRLLINFTQRNICIEN